MIVRGYEIVDAAGAAPAGMTPDASIAQVSDELDVDQLSDQLPLTDASRANCRGKIEFPLP